MELYVACVFFVSVVSTQEERIKYPSPAQVSILLIHCPHGHMLSKVVKEVSMNLHISHASEEFTATPCSKYNGSDPHQKLSFFAQTKRDVLHRDAERCAVKTYDGL